MPYALITLPDQPGRLLAGLRGGTVLITDDAGEGLVTAARATAGLDRSGRSLRLIWQSPEPGDDRSPGAVRR